MDPERVNEVVWRAKQKARPEISKKPDDWYMNSYWKQIDLDPNLVNDNIPRIDATQMNLNEFRQLYDIPRQPAVIQNGQCDWLAGKKWDLLSNSFLTKRLSKKYRNQYFHCGEDDDGKLVKMKLKYFVHYMNNNNDDSPLYIFDANFGEHRKKKRLLEDYKICEYFREDLFSYSSEKRRPPYRWFVMGSGRSGTGIHIDPLGTSAWNALCTGQKRWCLFPPETPKSMLLPRDGEGSKNKHEAITWFHYVYPKAKASSWPEQYRMYEILQQPGETVFIPGGWWHVVLNLNNTVAVTQNYCNSVNFSIVCYKLKRGRPKLSRLWLENLKIHRTDLYAIANTIDPTQAPPQFAPDSSDSSDTSSSSSSSNSNCPVGDGHVDSACSCSSCVKRTGRCRKSVTTETNDSSSTTQSCNAAKLEKVRAKNNHSTKISTQKRRKASHAQGKAAKRSKLIASNYG